MSPKQKSTGREIVVRLPLNDAQRIGGLHQGICTADFDDGTKVEVSSGWGLGGTDFYVSVNGKRRLSVDGRPLLDALIKQAVAEHIDPRKIAKAQP